MDKVQVRIGKLFTLFSLVLYLSKIAYCVFGGQPFHSLLEFDRLSYLIFSLLFGITIFWIGKVSEGIQVSTVCIIGIISLYVSPSTPLWGIFLFMVAFMLCYAYGLYSKRTVLRLVLSAIAIYSIFVFIPLATTENRFMRAFEWLLFISAFVLLLWMLFKDAIDRTTETKEKEKARYMQIIEEATSVARDALTALEKINKHNLGGSDGQ